MLVKIAVLILYFLSCLWNMVVSFYVAVNFVPIPWKEEAAVIMAVIGYVFITKTYLGLDKDLRLY